MKTNKLTEQYPWLAKINTVEDYLPPGYYKHLLKPYTFGGVFDLLLLEKFLQNRKFLKVLELGCGSGRASDTVVSETSNANYTFSDLSERMLESAKQHLPEKSSFEDYTSSVIKKFIRQNIAKNGSFFLIHFDSLSHEQRILMRQWKRVFPTFTNIDEQNPSKQIIGKTLLELDTKGEITLSINHLQGDAIHYESEDEVLEAFMNFHLETYFNDSPLNESVIEDIKEQASRHRNENGSFDITPGCYVYSFIADVERAK